MKTDPGFLGGLDGDVDQVGRSIRGKKVVVVRGQRAAGSQQFTKADQCALIKIFITEFRPDWIQGLQPGEQLAVDGRRPGAGAGLVQMMVGIDQPGQHDATVGVVRFEIRPWVAADQFGSLTCASGDDHSIAGGDPRVGQDCAAGVHCHQG